MDKNLYQDYINLCDWKLQSLDNQNFMENVTDQNTGFENIPSNYTNSNNNIDYVYSNNINNDQNSNYNLMNKNVQMDNQKKK